MEATYKRGEDASAGNVGEIGSRMASAAWLVSEAGRGAQPRSRVRLPARMLTRAAVEASAAAGLSFPSHPRMKQN
ncbi:hypothetical protein HJFPF1_09064 [Paramyrothecium foliicola]|nr:hypothetical protein HJFPF1_09064 [Paramyrothecium foliicola]